MIFAFLTLQAKCFGETVKRHYIFQDKLIWLIIHKMPEVHGWQFSFSYINPAYAMYKASSPQISVNLRR